MAITNTHMTAFAASTTATSPSKPPPSLSAPKSPPNGNSNNNNNKQNADTTTVETPRSTVKSRYNGFLGTGENHPLLPKSVIAKMTMIHEFLRKKKTKEKDSSF